MEVWDTIGLTADERRAAVIAIGEKLAAVAAQFVQSAQGDKKAYGSLQWSRQRESTRGREREKRKRKMGNDKQRRGTDL